MIRFAGIVLATAVSIAACTMLASRYRWITGMPTYFFESLAILTIFTLVIYRYLDRVSNPGVFIQLYLLSMVIKLLAYGTYVVVMIIGDHAGANRNVAFFMVMYFVFTALEVAFLYRKIAGNGRH